MSKSNFAGGPWRAKARAETGAPTKEAASPRAGVEPRAPAVRRGCAPPAYCYSRGRNLDAHRRMANNPSRPPLSKTRVLGSGITRTS